MHRRGAASPEMPESLPELRAQIWQELQACVQDRNHGWRVATLDGKTFDSSYDRGEPAVMPLEGVIPGWQEGLQLMAVGGKYKFWIPATLAYGEQAPPMIGPNQVLVFEVELLDIIKPGAKK